MDRVTAVLAGLAIMFSLEWWTGFNWYSALAFGGIGYGIVRYIGYFVRQRRHIRTVTEAAKRDESSN
jgi:hypothetical protein